MADPRLSAAAKALMVDPASDLLLSAVTLWELVDLNGRGRFGAALPVDIILDELSIRLVDTPVAACWLAATLPDVHRDPIDRLLIAHAIHAGLPIVTADATMRRYPVQTLG